MENPNPAQPTAQTVAPQLPPRHPDSKKRPLDNTKHFENSHFFKIRAIVRDLRPHFIEVLRTPEFQNCKAAQDIREEMSVLMDLYRDMIRTETTTAAATVERCKNEAEAQPVPGDVWTKQTPVEQQRQDVGPKPQSRSQAQPKPQPQASAVALEKKQFEDGKMQGSYIVGGSAFGWNFVTYIGDKSVYYGRTKESFRAENAIPPPPPPPPPQ